MEHPGRLRSVLGSWQLMALVALGFFAVATVTFSEHSEELLVGVATAADSFGTPDDTSGIDIATFLEQAEAEQRAAAREGGPAVGAAAIRPGRSGAAAPRDTDPRQVADPDRIRIPALDVSATMIELGLDAAGEIEVPVDAADAGWWRNGPEPGEPGAAVVLGHVDSFEGPGVFFGLHQLQVGDRILLDRLDGTTAVFAVTAGRYYEKSQFPTDLVYGDGVRRAGERALLRLVTCGGVFSSNTRSYDSNYVVFATLISA